MMGVGGRAEDARMTHQATLEQWHAAVQKALQEQAMDAIPTILVRMARDGWAAEAEDLRRRLAAVTSWMSAAPGAARPRDSQAAAQVATLVTAIRRGGLPVLRDVVEGLHRIAEPEAVREILVEAVATIAEITDRQAQEDFDRTEAQDEAEQIRRGGNR